jgi:ribose transport system substrate-binding protein
MLDNKGTIAMNRKRVAIKVCAAGAVLAATACGSTSPSQSSSSGPAIAASVLAAMNARVAAYTALPTFTPPGPPIDPSKLRGKRIFTVPFATNIPFCGQLDATMKTVAAQFGINFQDYPNQGQPSQWVAGLEEALSLHPSLVNIFCGIDPANLAPQVQALNAANIPVVSGHNYDPSEAPGPGLAAVVYAQYGKAGQADADWVITQTQGKANVLVVTDVSDPSTPPLVAAIKGEFAQCPGCHVTYSGVAVTDWGTKIEPIVASTITADPGLNYVIPIYDGMVGSVVPAITAAGATNRIHIATFNASPSVLSLIQAHNIVTFDIGEDFPGLSRAVLDQDFRVMLGVPPAQNEFAQLHGFSASNVDQAGTPPSFDQGYGTASVMGFNSLWGLG